jgi:hypothetical protein
MKMERQSGVYGKEEDMQRNTSANTPSTKFCDVDFSSKNIIVAKHRALAGTYIE